MRDIFPLNYRFLNRVLCPTVNSQVCREEVGKLLVVTSIRSTLFRQYWADLFYTYEITEIKAILLDDSGFFVVFLFVLLIFNFFLFFLPCLWPIWGTFGNPRSCTGVPEGILQP